MTLNVTGNAFVFIEIWVRRQKSNTYNYSIIINLYTNSHNLYKETKIISVVKRVITHYYLKKINNKNPINSII